MFPLFSQSGFKTVRLIGCWNVTFQTTKMIGLNYKVTQKVLEYENMHHVLSIMAVGMAWTIGGWQPCWPVYQENWFQRSCQKNINSPQVFSVVRVTQSLVLCVMFCRSLFVLFLLAILLFVLPQFADSDYPFGIFKLFLRWERLEKSGSTHEKKNSPWQPENKEDKSHFTYEELLSIFLAKTYFLLG